MKVIPERKTETIALKGLVMIYNHTKFEPESSKGCLAMAIQSLETKSILGVKNHVFPKFLENGKSEQGESGIKRKRIYRAFKRTQACPARPNRSGEKFEKLDFWNFGPVFFYFWTPRGWNEKKFQNFLCAWNLPDICAYFGIHPDSGSPIVSGEESSSSWQNQEKKKMPKIWSQVVPAPASQLSYRVKTWCACRASLVIYAYKKLAQSVHWFRS